MILVFGGFLAAGMPMVGATIPVLTRHSAELRHRQDDDVAHAIAEIGRERRHCTREVAEAVGELPGCAALVDVSVPAADVGERDLEADVGLDELRDLQETLSKL